MTRGRCCGFGGVTKGRRRSSRLDPSFNSLKQADRDIHSSHIPLSIHHLSHPRFPALCVSVSGNFCLLDHSLHQHAVSALFDSDEAPLPYEVHAAGVLSTPAGVIRVVLVDSRGHIRVLRLNMDDSAALTAYPVGNGWIGMTGHTEDLVAIDISEDGLVTALGQ